MFLGLAKSQMIADRLRATAEVSARLEARNDEEEAKSAADRPAQVALLASAMHHPTSFAVDSILVAARSKTRPATSPEAAESVATHRASSRWESGGSGRRRVHSLQLLLVPSLPRHPSPSGVSAAARPTMNTMGSMQQPTEDSDKELMRTTSHRRGKAMPWEGDEPPWCRQTPPVHSCRRGGRGFEESNPWGFLLGSRVRLTS